MPLTRTMLISSTNRGVSPQRLGDRGPDGPMLRHVTVAIGYELDDRQTMAPHGATDLAPECVPIPGPSMRRPEEPSRRANIETGGCPEEGFKRCRVELLGLRKKREDAAAVVVEDDNSGVQPELCRCEQAIQVMEKGKIADDQHQRAIRDGGGAKCGRDDAVDPVGAAIAHDPQPSPVPADEGIDVADRHAVADDKGRALG